MVADRSVLDRVRDGAGGLLLFPLLVIRKSSLRQTLAVLVALSVNSAAYSESKAVVVLYETDGTYVLTIKNGVASVVPAQVVEVGKPPGPPNPPPGPVELTERAKTVQRLALIVSDPDRAKNAQQLAALYDGLAKEVASGKITSPEALLFGVRTGADLLLTSSVARSAWQPTRDAISTLWVAVAQEGGTVQDYAKLLTEVSDGLEASVPADVQAIDLAMILEIIKIILELIARLKP